MADCGAMISAKHVIYLSCNFMRQVILFLLLTGILGLRAQTLVTVPLQTAPAVDGIYLPGEWSGAVSLHVPTTSGKAVDVMLQHDGSQLYLVFMGPMESASVWFPELLFDPLHDASASWQADDWWFHVSATDCENQGAYGVYSNCLTVQPDWKGVPNITSGGSVTDTVEVAIPFSKLGMVGPDSIGFALSFTNTASVWKMWPASANRNNPSTWGTMVLEPTATAVPEPVKKQFSVYPNPVTDGVIWIDGNSPEKIHWQLLDINGVEVDHAEVGEFPWQLSGGSGGRLLPPGIYLLKIYSKAGLESHTLILE